MVMVRGLTPQGKKLLSPRNQIMAEKEKGYTIFRPWITVNGKRIYAWQYGIKAFPIWVPETKKS